MTTIKLENLSHIFFIGVGGVGMSAIAQYLSGKGKQVAGSDRAFSNPDFENKKKLEECGISCYVQDGSGITDVVDAVVVSTAVEKSNVEYQKALDLNIPVIHRSEMLSMICDRQQTIAVAGTSGKSTTVALLYHILEYNGFSPSLISGAGLVDLEKKGLIGNAVAGTGEWLIVEADESDGTLVNYKPHTGIILNIDKDHKELSELEQLFKQFANNIKQRLIVNHDNSRAAKLSSSIENDFGEGTKLCPLDYSQDGFSIGFSIEGVRFDIPLIGRFNMENALAAIAVALPLGVSLQQAATALQSYKGIHRRQQLVGIKNGVIVIDDYAHNPVKVAAAIRACYGLSKRIIAWFQPHGFGPTRFLRKEFVSEISQALREDDQIWMSEIYYAGGTVTKDISAADLVDNIKEQGAHSVFISDRAHLSKALKPVLKQGDVLLLMGARDPSLHHFAQEIYHDL